MKSKYFGCLPIIVAFAILGATMLLVGCSFRADQPAPPPTLGETILSWGHWILGAGIASLGLGVVARLLVRFAVTGIAGWAASFILGLIPFPALASIGAGSVATGAAFIYLGQHMWLLVLALVATGVALALHHLADIRDWLHPSPAPVPSTAPVKPTDPPKAPAP